MWYNSNCDYSHSRRRKRGGKNMYERGKPDSGFKATRDRGENPASEISETLALVPLAVADGTCPV